MRGSTYALALAGLVILTAWIAGLAMMVIGIVQGNVPRAVGGFCLIVVLVLLIAIASRPGPRDPRKAEQETRAR